MPENDVQCPTCGSAAILLDNGDALCTNDETCPVLYFDPRAEAVEEVFVKDQDEIAATYSPEVVRAPFSAEQVGALNRFQQGGWMHPFTCGNRDQHEDEGVLIAGADGWTCPVCDYTQDWAFDFMADPNYITEAGKRWPMARRPHDLTIRESDGAKMCCICFEYRQLDEFYVDFENQRWDVCAEGNCASEAGLR